MLHDEQTRCVAHPLKLFTHQQGVPQTIFQKGAAGGGIAMRRQGSHASILPSDRQRSALQKQLAPRRVSGGLPPWECLRGPRLVCQSEQVTCYHAL